MSRCLLGLIALSTLGCGETPAPSARPDAAGAGAFTGAGASAGSGASAGAGATGGGNNGGSGATNGTGAAAGAGGSSAGSGGSAGSTPVSFSCDESAPGPAASLRRLTMTQYRNTVRDLVAWLTNDDPDVLAAATRALDTLPEDRREPVPEDLHGSYRRLDQTLQQVHVDTLYQAALAVGVALTSGDGLERSVGSCATDANADNDAACRDAFIERFGARALRRPLAADEIDFYRSVYGDDATADPLAYADLVTVFLNAPEFVYFVEHGGEEIAGTPGLYELTAHELASRLSYQLWQTAPDDQLLGAAADGSLLEASVYEAEVARLVSDPRARATLEEFFADWMKVEDLPELDAKNADPVFSAFAGEDLPGPGLRSAMIDDVLGLLDHYTWREPSNVSVLFTTDKSFARDEALARIYGTPVWDGESEPPSFPNGARPGLLTRALFLSTGTANTRPIMKGVFIRRRVLCDEIPPPPPGANAMPPELTPDLTTREVVEELTEMPGTNCAGCHAGLINALGFATENFDGLGRQRTEQALFEDDGTERGSRPVDTSGVPYVVEGDETPIEGASNLMTLMVASGKLEACLSRNYFRFTFARWEDIGSDGCALERMRSELAQGGSVQDLLAAAALSPAFRRRAFE
jgi:hypothetical protein